MVGCDDVDLRVSSGQQVSEDCSHLAPASSLDSRVVPVLMLAIREMGGRTVKGLHKTFHCGDTTPSSGSHQEHARSGFSWRGGVVGTCALS